MLGKRAKLLPSFVEIRNRDVNIGVHRTLAYYGGAYAGCVLVSLPVNIRYSNASLDDWVLHSGFFFAQCSRCGGHLCEQRRRQNRAKNQ